MNVILTDHEIEALLSGYERRRENLIPILQTLQEKMGYLSEAAVDKISEHLGLSANDVYGVVTFYTQFRFAPLGRNHLKVCRGTACHVRGSGLILQDLTVKLGIAPGQTSADLKFSLEQVACFGSCALAPVVVVKDKVYGRMTTKKTKKIIEGLK